MIFDNWKAWILTYLCLALFVIPIAVKAQGQGNCGTDWIAKDENAPFVYDGDQIITKIIIKASTDCFGYTYKGRSMILTECYNISGLGTTRVKVSDAPDAPSECRAISHVEFYANGEQPTLTPTRIATTPFKFWTFTPTITYPPPNTPTPPTYTPTVTLTLPPEVTLTSTPEGTPPDTLPPPPPRKTKTPQVILPATGEDNGALGTEELQWFFIVVFAGVIFAIVLHEVRKQDE
jgi:hypothetical protein